MTKEVKQYVKECDQCQRMKNRAEMSVGKLRPNQVPEKLWQHILVDFIIKLPMSKGHDAILVVCNRFSKIFYFVVMTEKTMAEGLVLKEGKVYVPKDKKLRVEIIRLHHDTPIAGHGG